MKILINANKEDRSYLDTLASLLKQAGLQALANYADHSIETLQHVAQKAGIDGIFLLNETTLCNITGYKRKANEKDSPLSKWRGSRLNFPIPVIVGAPPFWLFKVPEGKFIYKKDIEKLKRIKEPPLKFNYTVCETEENFHEAITVTGNSIILSADIETDIANQITSIAFTALLSANETQTFVIPFVDFGTPHWITQEQYGKAIQTLRTICKNSAPKLFWNGLYDSFFLTQYHAEPENWTLDGMGLFHCEYAELPKDLAFVTSLYCYDYLYWKDEADEAHKQKDISRFWAYNARDSWWALRTTLHIMKHAPKYAFTNYQKQFKLCYPSLYCSFEGWKINENQRRQDEKAARLALQTSLTNLRKMAANLQYNPRSPKQTAIFLYDILGAKPTKDFKGNPTRSTDEQTLGRLSIQHPIIKKVVDEILEFRGKAKEISTYYCYEQWETKNGQGNRILYTLDPWMTATDRFSSHQSSLRRLVQEEDGKWKLKSLGVQIQNVPRPTASPVKKHFIADDGYILLEPDNSKSEARCVAVLSNCKAMLSALSDPERDFYKQLGVLLFGMKYEDVTTEMREKVNKRINHASNYMMQEKTFVDTATIPKILEAASLLNIIINPEIPVIPGKQYQTPEQFARYLLDIYHKPFPELKKWWESIKLEIIRHQKLVSPLGHVRFFFGDISKSTAVLRSAVAHVPQNLSVEILNRGWWKIYKELVLPSKGEYRLKAQVHDSSPAQCLASKKEYYEKKTIELLTHPPLEINGNTLQIPVECKSGLNWAEMKK